MPSCGVRIASLLLLLALVHCGDDAPPPPVDGSRRDGGTDATAEPDVLVSGEPRITIGHGLTAYEDVPEGGDAELVAGPQGGWHVNLALRIYSIDPEDLSIRIEGFDAETGDVLSIPIERILTSRRVRREDDHYLRLGDQLIFMITMPSEAVGRDLRVELTAMPTAGGVFTATHTFHAVDEEE